MANTALLTVAAVVLFALALMGSACVKCIASISSRLLLLANAVSGGLLIAVALVHMLSENSEGLEAWGKAVNANLGGDAEEAFPLGFMLLGLGFFLIIALELLLGGHDHEEKGHGYDEEEEPSSGDSSDSDHEAATKSKGSIVGGLGTLVGITFHSFIESTAMGSTEEESAFATLIVAVLFHKGATGFAVGNSLRAVNADNPALWWVFVVIFAASAPVGIAVGASIGEELEGESAAALQCVAGGTLLAIGITEMLLPALSGSEVHKKSRLFGAIAAFAAMSFVAVWA